MGRQWHVGTRSYPLVYRDVARFLHFASFDATTQRLQSFYGDDRTCGNVQSRCVENHVKVVGVAHVAMKMSGHELRSTLVDLLHGAPSLLLRKLILSHESSNAVVQIGDEQNSQCCLGRQEGDGPATDNDAPSTRCQRAQDPHEVVDELRAVNGWVLTERSERLDQPVGVMLVERRKQIAPQARLAGDHVQNLSIVDGPIQSLANSVGNLLPRRPSFAANCHDHSLRRRRLAARMLLQGGLMPVTAKQLKPMIDERWRLRHGIALRNRRAWPAANDSDTTSASASQRTNVIWLQEAYHHCTARVRV
jgi:hypothetical protein